MKRNKLLLCILCIILMMLCCSCGMFGRQKYVCEVDNVKSVQIIRLDEYVKGEYRFEYTVLSNISDYKTFARQGTVLCLDTTDVIWYPKKDREPSPVFSFYQISYKKI